MDNFSFELLQLYSIRNTLSLFQLEAILNQDVFSLAKPINYLRDKEYLEILPSHAISKKLDKDSDISPNTPLSITYLGKAALETEIKARKHFKYNEIRAWITLAIAIAAFILSVISLCLQYK